jgi:hypothetical protein
MGVIKDLSSNRYDSLIHPRLRNQSAVVKIAVVNIISSIILSFCSEFNKFHQPSNDLKLYSRFTILI